MQGVSFTITKVASTFVIDLGSTSGNMSEVTIFNSIKSFTYCLDIENLNMLQKSLYAIFVIISTI